MNSPVQFVGMATGPAKFVPEFGCEVNTFTQEPGGKKPALTYHVPLHMRGDYRPEELANFNPQKTYRTDPLGKMLCYGQTKAGERCNRRAVNRYPRCDIHGGRLHPLDKIIPDRQEATNPQEAQSLSRYKQFLAGQITVDDLDDEELAVCGFRAANGSIFKPRNVPREMAQAFQRAIYERAQTELRSLTVEAAQTMGEIMKNKNVEPDIRLKAALSIIERNLGKTPQVIAVTDAKAYEEVFETILPISREESRKARGIESSTPAIESNESNTIDVEVIEDDPDDDEPDEQEEEQREAAELSNLDSIDTRDENGMDARLFARNPAILAPTIEIKSFEYDLSNHDDDIKKETKKRYAKRAQENTPDVPLVLIKTQLDDWRIHVSIDTTKLSKPKKPTKAQVAQRKSYTLNDFS